MRIQATDERHYLVEVFTKLGFNQDDSQLLADTLVDADLRGSHLMGFNDQHGIVG